MRIAFVGDSFCGGMTPNSWTDILASRLDATIACRGQGGVSVGQAYFDLMEHLDGSDLFLMFYTDHYRLFNPHQYPLNAGSLVDYDANGLRGMKSHDTTHQYNDDGLWRAASLYYRHLFHEPYHALLHDVIVERCDAILADHIARHPRKRVLHFHSFMPSNGIGPMASGPCCTEAMTDYMARRGKPTTAGDWDDNHMTVGQNAEFADAVYDVLCRVRAGMFRLP